MFEFLIKLMETNTNVLLRVTEQLSFHGVRSNDKLYCD